MKELDKSELQNVEGGFVLFLIWLSGEIALQTVLVGLLAAGIAGSFEKGYDSEIHKKS